MNRHTTTTLLLVTLLTLSAAKLSPLNQSQPVPANSGDDAVPVLESEPGATLTLTQPGPALESPPAGSPACPGDCILCPEGGQVAVSELDSVYLFSGESWTNPVDLRIPGRGLDVVWARKYRSEREYDIGMGTGWDYSYNIHVSPYGDDFIVHDGNTREDTYADQGDGTWIAPEFFRVLHENPDLSLTLTFPDTGVWNFCPRDGRPEGGRICSIVDRNANTIAFEYDPEGRLTTIHDTLDTELHNRDITITWHDHGRLASVTDFAGRTVSYEYYEGQEGGSNFDLMTVTTPAVMDTPEFHQPPGHEYPAGKTTVYTYTTGFPQELNHDLLTITDAKGQVYLTNVYAHTIAQYDPEDPPPTEDPGSLYYDRLVRQYRGEQDPLAGDIIDVVYNEVEPLPENNFAVIEAIVNDRVGNVRIYAYDADNRMVVHREYTGRWDPDRPTFDVTAPDFPKLRPGDPDYYEDTRWYNADALVTDIEHPNDNWEDFYYDDANENRRAQGNMLQHCRIAFPLGGDQPDICESFEYADGYGGCCGTNFVTWHMDGRFNVTEHEYDTVGNRTHTTHRIPFIVEDFEYNIFGQVTTHVLPNNDGGHRRRDAYAYYEEADGPQYGYLREKVVDADFYLLTSTYEYDLVGNVTRAIDPRGNDTQYMVNQLNQTVREISPEVEQGGGVRYARDTFYDPNDNVVRVGIQNVDEFGEEVLTNPEFTTVYEYDILNTMTRRCEESGQYNGPIPGTQEIPLCEGLPPEEFITTESMYDANRNRTLQRSGEATEGRDPLNEVETLYDERDLVFQTIRAPGEPLERSTTQHDYDGNRNPIRVTQGLEAQDNPRYPGDEPHVTQNFYDGFDRLWGGLADEPATIDPMGNATVEHYDANGNTVYTQILGELVDVPGSAGNVRLHESSYEYDPMDRLVRTVTEHFDTETQAPVGDGNVINETVYSDTSQVMMRINDNLHATMTHYDFANRRWLVLDPKGNEVEYFYDENSKVTEVSERDMSDLGAPMQEFTTSYEYDGLNRLTATTNNIGSRGEYWYDSRDNEVLAVDFLWIESRTVYDGVNRVLKTIRDMDGDGADPSSEPGDGIPDIVTARSWDDNSRLTGQTDDNGNISTYSYDPLNRLIGKTLEDATISWSQYDSHDNAFDTIDANGTYVHSTYDLLNRVLLKDIQPVPPVSDDTTFEIYAYDGFTRPVHMEDDDAIVTRSYDSQSNVVAETLNGQMTTALYDGEGNQIEAIYPGGRVVGCVFDELDREKQFNDPGGMITTYYYVGRDRVESRELGNGIYSDYFYDGIAGEPNPPDDEGVKQIIATIHTRMSDGSVIDARAYDWDAMYNKKRRLDTRSDGPQLTHEYILDGNECLELALVYDNEGGTVRETFYDLDDVGNREVVTGEPDPGEYFMDSGTPEPADYQMNQYTTTPFDERHYDDNGNLILRTDEAELFYDYRNRLVQYHDVLGEQWNGYSYDPLGRRIGRIVNGDEPRYFYNDLRVCEEQDDMGITLATYVYGNYVDEVLSMQRDGRDYYYHADDMYNVMAVSALPGAAWSDNFDSYEEGLLIEQSDWEAWEDNPDAANFVVTAAQFRSPPHALAITGDDDAVHQYSGHSASQWSYDAWVFIPPEMDDLQYFILVNTYPAVELYDWSLQIEIDGANDLFSDYNSEASLPLIKGAWSHIEVLIDLDADQQTVLYDGAELLTKSWTAGVEPGGALNIAAVDLWGGGSIHPLYYDDMELGSARAEVIERYEYGDYGRPEIVESVVPSGRCPSDIDFDGMVAFSDLLLILANWGPCDECLYDLSGNGMVDFADILMVLSEWGPCPMPIGEFNPYLFTGRRFDHESELYYYRTRYLDPQAGRFVSRDPLGMWTDTNNTGNGTTYAGNNPFTNLDPSGKITVTRKSFTKKTCGGFNIKWVFKLDKPAPTDGYFVQKVTDDRTIAECNKAAKKSSKTFYEAWFIKKGAKLEELHSSYEFTDEWNEGPHPGTCGKITDTGTVKFFCTGRTGDLGKQGKKPKKPNNGWGPGAEPWSGDLPSTGTKPKWWDGASCNGEKTASTSVKADWDCCVNPPKNSVIPSP